MRLPQLLLAAAAAVLLAPAAQAAGETPYERAMGPYLAELDRQCPGRDLQDLSLGEFNRIMEGFDDHLTKPQQRTVERQVGRDCRHQIAGIGCANTGSLLAYERLGVLPRFVAQVCATPVRCKAFADCEKTKP